MSRKSPNTWHDAWHRIRNYGLLPNYQELELGCNFKFLLATLAQLVEPCLEGCVHVGGREMRRQSDHAVRELFNFAGCCAERSVGVDSRRALLSLEWIPPRGFSDLFCVPSQSFSGSVQLSRRSGRVIISELCILRLHVVCLSVHEQRYGCAESDFRVFTNQDQAFLQECVGHRIGLSIRGGRLLGSGSECRPRRDTRPDKAGYCSTYYLRHRRGDPREKDNKCRASQQASRTRYKCRPHPAANRFGQLRQHQGSLPNSYTPLCSKHTWARRQVATSVTARTSADFLQGVPA